MGTRVHFRSRANGRAGESVAASLIVLKGNEGLCLRDKCYCVGNFPTWAFNDNGQAIGHVLRVASSADARVPKPPTRSALHGSGALAQPLRSRTSGACICQGKPDVATTETPLFLTMTTTADAVPEPAGPRNGSSGEILGCAGEEEHRDGTFNFVGRDSPRARIRGHHLAGATGLDAASRAQAIAGNRPDTSERDRALPQWQGRPRPEGG